MTAADQALAAGRWGAAREHLAAALADRDTAEAHEAMGRAMWWLGEVRESLVHRERAYAGYQSAGRLPEATIVALDVSVCYLSNLDNQAAAQGWLARARRTAGESGNDALDPWIWLLEAYLSTDLGAKRELLDRTLQHARASRQGDLELSALADLGLAMVVAGEVEDGLCLLDEAMAGTLAGDYGRLDTVVWTSCSMLAACSLVGDLRRAAQWCREADRFSATYGCPFLQATCRSHYGRVLVATGDWAHAESELSSVLSAPRELGRGPRVEALAGLAELRLRQGRLEQAEALVEEAGLDPETAVVAALVQVARGRPAAGASMLRDRLDRLNPHDLAYPPVAAALVEAYVSLGDLASAKKAADALAKASRGHQHPQTAALASRAAGLLAAAARSPDQAVRSLRVAVEEFEGRELPFEAARTRLDLAHALVAVEPTMAVVEARRAGAVLTALGAEHEADRAAALLRDLGVATRTGPRDAGVLTLREREVLALVQRGLTNPQIAARLYISPRTVGHHVSSILAKLGLSTRAEAAAFAATLELAERPSPGPGAGPGRGGS